MQEKARICVIFFTRGEAASTKPVIGVDDNTDNIALAINVPASDKGGKSTMKTMVINNEDNARYARMSFGGINIEDKGRCQATGKGKTGNNNTASYRRAQNSQRGRKCHFSHRVR